MMGDLDGEVTFTLHVNYTDPQSPDTEGEESPSELERQRIVPNNYVAAHRNVSSSDDAHSHGDSHDTQPMAPLRTLSYDSSPRESDDMLGYESSARENDDMLGYESSARESDDMQDGDPSPREDDGEVQMTQP